MASLGSRAFIRALPEGGALQDRWRRNRHLPRQLCTSFPFAAGLYLLCSDIQQEETTDSTIARIADTAANMRKKRMETDALKVIAKGAVQHVSEDPKKAPSKKKGPKDQRPPRVVSSSSSPGIVAIATARLNAGRNHIEPVAMPPTSHYTELGLLRQRLNRAENEILHREQSCRVCGAVFLSTLSNAADQVRNPSQSRMNRILTDEPDSGALCNARYVTWASLSARRVPRRSRKPHSIPFIRGKDFPMNGVAS